MHHRSRVAAGAAALAVLLGPLAPARAQEFPTRPIQVLIGTLPGGAVDVLGRALAEGMSAALGGPVVAMNREGANGVISVGQVARAAADGYTLGFMGAAPFVSQPFLRNDLPYQTSEIDFLCQAFEIPVALVVPQDSPFRTLEEFVAAAKTKPGQLNVGHGGIGSVPQLAVAQFEKNAGVKFNQVPFKGDPDQTAAVMGKHLDAAVPGLSSVAGKPVRVLAVFAGERAETHPNVPTVKESGFGVVKVGMVGLYTRKGIPPAVREKLVAACKSATEGELYHRASARSGQAVGYLGPEQWSARLAKDARQNKAIVEALK